MNEEKKQYLSLYLLQHAKIHRLNGMICENPSRRQEYLKQIEEVNNIRCQIEEKINQVDGGVLTELLYLKYVCGKTLLEISYILNYSLRHTERLHIKALMKFKM